MLNFDIDLFDIRSTLFEILDLNSDDKFQNLNESFLQCVKKGNNKNEIRAEKLQIFRPLIDPVYRHNLDHFQEVFDQFVRTVIVKDVAATYPSCGDTIYYQSFPCIRMVRPGEFSIGNVVANLCMCTDLANTIT